ncbi:MAG: thiamine pyrophosphate-requiring protein [Polyangiaceae bacterium]
MSNVSEYVLDRLSEWGIQRIYGYPGDGINAFLYALEERRERLRFIQARHEELAAFMACAHAKFTGQVGVCLATSGPGAIHLLNGLYDAAKDNQPVLAIVGQQAATALGTDYQQEVDLISLFKDVAHHYCHMCSTPSQARHLIDRGMRIAQAQRAVTCVIIPNDIGAMDYEEPTREHGNTFTGVGYTPPRVIPQVTQLKRAAEVLNSGSKVAMLIGAGALGAGEEVMSVADALGAGVAKALLGKAALPDDLPYVTGGIGLLGTEPSDRMMRDCDRFFMVGSSFPYSEWLPKEDVVGVQIDIRPRNLNLRFPMDVALCGDTRETLRALLPLIERKADRSWRETIEKNVSEWWKKLEKRAFEGGDPINPQRVFWELSPRLPDRCILTSDSGSSANWWARDLKIRPGMMASLSGNLATMCPGVPYALAAKLCHPDRPVVACVGDGAMQMLGNNALITAARYWEEWSDPRMLVVVLNNRDLNQVTWEQRVMSGDAKAEVTQTIPEFDYAGYARMIGLEGIRVERVDDLTNGIEAALAAKKPCVLECVTDPETPPLPPHISFDQAKKFWSSMLRDPARGGAVKQALRNMFPSGDQ